MDKVFIRGLRARSVIGVNDWERKDKQEVLIDIELFVDSSKAGERDDLSESADYRSVAKDVLQHVESAQRFTVEALAEDIARLCLERTIVESVKVRVAKPGAVRFTDTVGIEIQRPRKNQK